MKEKVFRRSKLKRLTSFLIAVAMVISLVHVNSINSYASEMQFDCGMCNGIGRIPTGENCLSCDGWGYYECLCDDENCEFCGGTGSYPCASCGGTGCEMRECEECGGSGKNYHNHVDATDITSRDTFYWFCNDSDCPTGHSSYDDGIEGTIEVSSKAYDGKPVNVTITNKEEIDKCFDFDEVFSMKFYRYDADEYDWENIDKAPTEPGTYKVELTNGIDGYIIKYFDIWTIAQVTKADTTHGSFTVTADGVEISEAAGVGTTLTVNPTPDAGYVVDTITVTDANNKSVEVTDGTFVMPKADVTVSVTFKEVEAAKYQIYVSVKLTGDEPLTDADFTIKLEAVGGSPMPEEDTITIKGEDYGKFGEITFCEEGEYYYTISQIAGSDEHYDYDDKVFDVKFEVFESNGKLEAKYYPSYNDFPSDIWFENTYTADRIDILGCITWDDEDNNDGKRPESVEVTLYADGEYVDSKSVSGKDESSEYNFWAYCFEDLYKYNDNGDEIEYTIEVNTEELEEYDVEYHDYDTTRDVTLTHNVETIDVGGDIYWEDEDDNDGKRPESVEVLLYKDGVYADIQTVYSKNGWEYSFDDVNKYYQGNEIEYTVEVNEIDNYEVNYNVYDITCTHEPETVTVKGSITWDDDDDRDKVRPDIVQVNFYVNGKQASVCFITAQNNWEYELGTFNKYNAGEEIAYVVSVGTVDNYTSSITGYDTTLTHKPETVNVGGDITWIDSNNNDGKRPESVTVKLLADGTLKESKTVTASDNWLYSFNNVYKYDKGVEIKYTIEADEIDAYKSEVKRYTLVCTHERESVEIKGSIVWKDANDNDGKRPENFKFTLYNNGNVLMNGMISADDKWSFNCGEFLKYDQGKENEYTIEAEAIEGYQIDVQMANNQIICTHFLESVDIDGSIIWDDKDNVDGIRPESVTVRFYANGEEQENTTLFESNKWSYSFSDYDKYASGEEIEYTLTVDSVDGYTSTISGNDITLTHIHEHVFDIEKVLEGDSNLKEKATYKTKAVYFKVCKCGEISTEETFEYGEVLEKPEEESEIKGICQMPNPNGGGALIGFEPTCAGEDYYSAEILILDCTKLANNDPYPWIYSTGKCGFTEAGLWTIVDLQYGYYWTLFRVYDIDGNIVDEQCYGFENI